MGKEKWGGNRERSRDGRRGGGGGGRRRRGSSGTRWPSVWVDTYCVFKAKSVLERNDNEGNLSLRRSHCG